MRPTMGPNNIWCHHANSHKAWNGPFYRRCGFTELTSAQLSLELTKILQQEEADGFSNRVAMLALLP